MTGSIPPGQRMLYRDLYLGAIAAIEAHGDKATQYAARQSAKFEKCDDYQASTYWDGVILAILELERSWLRSDETCN
jgi:hypothetical protein